MKTKSCLYNLFLLVVILTSCSSNKKNVEMMKYNELTPFEKEVILNKGTEQPFTGEYVSNSRKGTYICKQCNAELYKTNDQFESHCGWPSFDDEIEGAITRVPDADGRRTEIICKSCGGHLGHVFLGEEFTEKNTRHCVNSVSIKFIEDKKAEKTTEKPKAYFASGCFWGTEYFFNKAKGVTHTTVGFMGGHVDAPTYNEVCKQDTGHLELTEIEYNPKETSYEDLVKLFFETHDFTQTNGQGPDIGPQYLSCIFYNNEDEKGIAEKYIQILTDKGYQVATQLRPVETFWQAEDYHQQYYDHKGTTPYCHAYKKIF